MNVSLWSAVLLAALNSGAIMPHDTDSGKARRRRTRTEFSAKRNGDVTRRMGGAQRYPSIPVAREMMGFAALNPSYEMSRPLDFVLSPWMNFMVMKTVKCKQEWTKFIAYPVVDRLAVCNRARLRCALHVRGPGEGHVAAVIDVRHFRLDDGSEIRLAGIEPADADKAKSAAALAAVIGGHDVTLRGDDDTPDRYGRQTAFVFVVGSESSVQSELLRRGQALSAADIADRECAGTLAAAETEASKGKIGIWSAATAIKNAESPGDILAGIGRFMVVEGRVLSVRQAGATTYLNFGRSWTQGFAATISRRMMPAFETAGLTPKSLENKRIRVRGFVSSRGGPRIEVLRVGQIEVLGVN